MKFNFLLHKITYYKGFRVLVVAVFIFILVVIYLKNNDILQASSNCLADPPNCKNFSSVKLVALDYIEPSENSIFFLEDHNHDFISPRVLCSVESAAVTNPDRSVYLLTTSKKIYHTPALIGVLARRNNIHFGYLDPWQLFYDTPLFEWYRNKRWTHSKWPTYHFSDAIRWLMLWVHGGVYMDTDIILMRKLPNSSFVALESKTFLGAGALGLPAKHEILTRCVNEIANHYDPNVWGNLGPELLTKVLLDICGKDTFDIPSAVCPDIFVLRPNAFYPIHWRNWRQYFSSHVTKNLFTDQDIYGLHVWNALSKNELVNLMIQTPFTVAAYKFCPTVVKAVKNKM